jgi:hypothetical protein
MAMKAAEITPAAMIITVGITAVAITRRRQ